MQATRDRKPRPGVAAKKAATHERIVSSAVAVMRREGLGAASVERVMRGAGLTVGGFYAHFESRDAMDAEVLERTLSDSARAFLSAPEDPADTGIKKYLSPRHRDAANSACPLPAVLSELTRSPKTTRKALANSIEVLAEEYARAYPELPKGEARSRAMATLAICVGGLNLARALKGFASSDEMLEACIRHAPGREKSTAS